MSHKTSKIILIKRPNRTSAIRKADQRAHYNTPMHVLVTVLLHCVGGLMSANISGENQFFGSHLARRLARTIAYDIVRKRKLRINSADGLARASGSRRTVLLYRRLPADRAIREI